MKTSPKTPRVTLLALATAVAVLAGCASKVPLDDKAPVESRTPGSIPGGSAGAGDTGSQAQSQVTPVNLGPDDGTTGAARVVYFDYDSFVVKSEYRPAIENNAKMLNADRKKRVTIEGHTDERGGREYNLALGQKRAEAVARAMAILGATETQVEAVSFGKERPAAQGSDEAAWAKNRRAEIKDRK